MKSEDRDRWWQSRGRSELRDLLMAHWDPIGVSGVPEARDEYDEYLEPLAGELAGGTDAVARYLADVQSERMGLPATPDQLLEVAGRVVDWYSGEMQRPDARQE